MVEFLPKLKYCLKSPENEPNNGESMPSPGLPEKPTVNLVPPIGVINPGRVASLVYEIFG